MATTRQYWNAVKTTRNTISLDMGTYLPSMEPTVRAGLNADLAVVAIVIKALTDNGILTDAQLQAAQVSALADIWDQEPPIAPIPAD
jgi:hypothetical protein